MNSNLEAMFIESELIVPVSIEFHDDLSFEDFQQLCRLCGNSSDQLMPIFSGEGSEHNLPDKIKEHLPIIEVSISDTLPLSICYQCASTLISWHELYYACKDADHRLRAIWSRLKLEKFDPEENFMDVNDNASNSDVDQYETIELSRKRLTLPKPEIVTNPVEKGMTDAVSTSSNVPETVMCSDPTEESVAVDSELEKSISENRSAAKPAIVFADVTTNYSFDSLTPSSSADVKDALLGISADYCPPSPPDLEAIKSVEVPYPRTNANGRFQCNKCNRRFSSDVFHNMHYNESRVVFANPFMFHDLYELMRSHPLLPPDRIDPNRPFRCAQCDQTFDTKREVRLHIYCYHPSVAKFKCDFCSATFVAECDLAEHRVAHSVERQLICLACGRRRATGSLPYEANKSRIAFAMCSCKNGGSGKLRSLCAQKENAARATGTIVEKRRRDPKAAALRQRQAIERAERARQRQEKLNALGKVCNECGKEFATRLSLRRHSRLHKNLEVCKFCGKSYSSAYMKSHLLIHGPEKKFVCQKCGKRFAQLSSLRSHQLLEENVRKFVCSVCGMRFVLSSRFHSHMKTHLDDLPFKCEDCGRGYGYIWQLRQHRVRHSNVRPFSCELCGRSYKTMKHLRQHSVVHSRLGSFDEVE